MIHIRERNRGKSYRGTALAVLALLPVAHAALLFSFRNTHDLDVHEWGVFLFVRQHRFP